jgi:transposase
MDGYSYPQAARPEHSQDRRVAADQPQRCAACATQPGATTGKRQRAKGVKLEPFKGLIAGWLRDEVTSQWTAERIFDELHDRGYDGGRTVIKDYVHEHRPRPAPMAEARFHVKPGQQVQVDWAEMGPVEIGGVQRKLVRVRLRFWLGRERCSFDSRPTCSC